MYFKNIMKCFKLTILLIFLHVYESRGWDSSDVLPNNEWWPQETTESSKLSECGVGITPLITDMNGTRNANEGEIVWQVSIQTKIDGKWAHSCGGVVINNNYVLTSAKCVDGSDTEAYVRSEAGSVDLPKGGWVRRKRDLSYPGQQLPGLQYTQRVIKHPEYDQLSLKNNLALICLAQPFDVKKAEGKINSICLSDKTVSAEDELFISGWGSIANATQLNPKLQVIKAKITECNSKESDDNKLCVFQYEKSSSEASNNCQGDSGGPLFWNNGTNSFLIGIYSTGKDCSNEEPAEFTKTKPYLDWINENSKPIY